MLGSKAEENLEASGREWDGLWYHSWEVKWTSLNPHPSPDSSCLLTIHKSTTFPIQQLTGRKKSVCFVSSRPNRKLHNVCIFSSFFLLFLTEGCKHPNCNPQNSILYHFILIINTFTFLKNAPFYCLYSTIKLVWTWKKAYREDTLSV